MKQRPSKSSNNIIPNSTKHFPKDSPGDEAELHRWYSDVIREHHHTARQLDRYRKYNIYAEYYFLALNVFGVIAGTIGLLTPPSSPDAARLPFLALALLLLNGSMTGFILYAWSAKKRKAREVATEREKGNYWVPESEDIPEATALVQDIRKKYRIDLGDQVLQILISRSMASFPSIEAADGKIYLILPIGFFMVLQTNSEHAAALIAHELAHLKHGDLSVWTELSSETEIARFLEKLLPLYITIAIGIFLTSFTAKIAGNGALTGIYYCAFVYYSRSRRKKVVSARQGMETLADFLAAHHTSPQTVIEVLQTYGRESDTGGRYHPKLADRIAALESMRLLPGMDQSAGPSAEPAVREGK
ncbi:MAG: M48 family metalloprotease [Bacteroidota bacterium]